MDAQRWREIQSLFLAALDREPGDRSTFVADSCPGDPELRREVEALLSGHDEHRALAIEDRLLVDERDSWSGEPDLAGTRIGPYRLVRCIGRGGMGDVFLAEREEAYRQEVAVKLVRPGLDPSQVVRRFQAERQILARLVHPNIARLLDGGVAADGRPYLVMEYIAGLPITTYCDKHRLTIDERLQLFRTACEAVQFAHRNLIVHRDVKPSNVLVTEAGDVKLLDFGIAKMLNPDAEELDPAVTQTAVRLMTPEYAAPEQVRGEPITTATDVYTLGILLYELLTGHHPHRVPVLTPAEIERIICTEDPSWPSIVVTTTAEAPSAVSTESVTPERVSADRRTEAVRLRRTLAGDLDTIVMMALRKEPERRYASASQLADDVARYLEGRPVIARKDTAGYRIRKFVRRHRMGVAVAAAGAVLVMVSGIAVGVQAARIAAQADQIAVERDRAQSEAEKATQVAAFLENLFESTDPYATSPDRRDTLRIADLLTLGAQQVREELADQPAVQAQLFNVLGRVFRSLGRFEEARPLYEASVEIRRGLGPAERKDLMETLVGLALLLNNMGAHEEAEPLYREALSLAEDGDGPPFIQALRGLGNLMQDRGEYDEAEQLYRESLRVSRAHFGDDDGDVSVSLMNIATVLVRKADYEGAEPLMREALAINRRLLGPEHPRVAQYLNNLAFVLTDVGDLEGAEAMYREALAIYRGTFEPPHPQIARVLNNLAYVVMQRGDNATARGLYREALDMRRALHGNEHPDVGNTMVNLAMVAQRSGDLEGAENLLREASDLLGTVLGERHPRFATATANLGDVLHLKGNHHGAQGLLRAALDVRRQRLPPGHPDITAAAARLGRCLVELERFDEAEQLLLGSFEALEGAEGERSASWTLVVEQLAALYHATGKADQAARFDALAH